MKKAAVIRGFLKHKKHFKTPKGYYECL